MFETFFWEVGENGVFHILQHWGYLPAKGGNNSLPSSGKKIKKKSPLQLKWFGKFDLI